MAYLRALTLLLFFSMSAESPKEDSSCSEVWQQLQDKSLNSYLRPNFSDEATEVRASVTIIRISKVNEVSKTFTVELFVRQFWFDYRLKHNLSTILTPYLGQNIAADFIWVPDTVFKNSQYARRHKATSQNEKLDIYPNGQVAFGSRYSVDAKCDFDLRNYPMDTQNCIIGLESYAYDKRHLVYYWKDDMEVWPFNMLQYSTSNFTFQHRVRNYVAGQFSVLEAKFTLERKLAFSIMQIFFPCTVLVCLSWLTFWFHVNCVSARMGIGITSLLTISKLWSNVNAVLPSVSYTKASDVYMVVSFTFILMTLVEYAVQVNLEPMWQKKKKEEEVEGSCVGLAASRVFQEEQWKRRLMLSRSRERSRSPNCALRSHAVAQISKEAKQQKCCTDRPPFILLSNRATVVTKRRMTSSDKKHVLKTDYIKMWREFKYEQRPYYYKPYMVTGPPSSVDIISRLIFPFAYVLFNIWFWTEYNNKNSEMP